MIQTTDSKWNMVAELDENILCSPKKSYYDEKGFDNERLLAILYTSGSTGVPKGARIMHSSAINRLNWQWDEFPYKEGDVCAFKVRNIN